MDDGKESDRNRAGKQRVVNEKKKREINAYTVNRLVTTYACALTLKHTLRSK